MRCRDGDRWNWSDLGTVWSHMGLFGGGSLVELSVRMVPLVCALCAVPCRAGMQSSQTFPWNYSCDMDGVWAVERGVDWGNVYHAMSCVYVCICKVWTSTEVIERWVRWGVGSVWYGVLCVNNVRPFNRERFKLILSFCRGSSQSLFHSTKDVLWCHNCLRYYAICLHLKWLLLRQKFVKAAHNKTRWKHDASEETKIPLTKICPVFYQSEDYKCPVQVVI